MVNSGL